MFLYIRLKLGAEISSCQILSSVLLRTTNTLSTRSLATSSSIIIKIASDELNDEGSDTVFHA